MDAQQKWDTFYGRKEREAFLHFSQEQLTDILADFPKAKTILDIGCGEGQLMEELERRGFTAEGVDPSSVALNTARKTVRGFLRQGTFEEVEFESSKKFDLIFVKFVIAFIANPAIFFKKINNLLTDDGGLIILTPVIDGQKSDNEQEEVFVSRSVLDEFLSKYFDGIAETVFYAEEGKKLSLFVCKKRLPTQE